MATVFRGRDRLLGGQVAVKVLTRKAPRDAERFEREALVLSRLSHPAIVSYVAHGRTGGTPYVVMEWLEGDTLSRLLRRGGRLREGETLALGLRLAQAIGAMHDQEIL